MNRPAYFQYCAQLVSDIEGSFVEMGFRSGNSSVVFASAFEGSRDMWVFDSFQGFPPSTKEDYTNGIAYLKEGSHSHPNNMKNALKLKETYSGNVYIMEGFFKDTISQYSGGPIAILNLDCDLYESYKICLENLYSKVSSNGIILFDEYESPGQLKKFPGASKAIREFLGDRAKLIQKVILNNQQMKWFIRKPE